VAERCTESSALAPLPFDAQPMDSIRRLNRNHEADRKGNEQ